VRADTNGGHRPPIMVMVRAVWALLVGFLARRHRPSPFFGDEGKPVVEPEVLG
jgi:hypothetical protein